MSLSTLFFNSYVFSKNITFARVIDSTGDDQGLSVTCDSSGNVYFSGYYTGTPSIITQFGGTVDILPASTSTSAFVCKFNSSGVYQYSRIVDSAGADQGNCVACDSAGNMYLSGFYTGTPTIKDQGGNLLNSAVAPTSNVLPASTSAAVFVSKFDSSGTYQYSRIVDSAGYDAGQGVACDSSDNMYIAGRYAGTPTIKSQGGFSLGTLPASSVDAAFLCKFNSTGTYQYSRIVDGTGTELGYSVACDSSGNVYLGGYYVTAVPTVKDQTGAALTAAVAPLVSTLPAPSSECAFVSKFNSSGTYQYSRVIDGTGAERIFNITCDSSGNLYVAGYYGAGAATVKDQGGNSLTAAVAPLVSTLPAGTGNIAFVSKFNSSGTYQYSRIVESTGNELAWGVGCDPSGNMYFVGQYTGTTTVKDQGNATLATLPSVLGYTGFLVKFDSTGTYQTVRIVDASSDDRGYGVASDSSGNVYFSGYYNGTTPNIRNQAGTSLGTLPASAASTAAFLVKFDSTLNYQPTAQAYPTFTRIIDSAGNDAGEGVVCDSSGNMYIAGYYTGTPTIKDQSGTGIATLPAPASTAAFISKFNSSGTYQYSSVLDAATVDQALGVARDSSDNIYFSGYYRGTPTVYFVNSSNVSTVVATLPASAGGLDTAFVSKCNSSGTYQYSRIIESTGGDQGLSVACDPSDNMYVSGSYSGTPTIYSINSSNVSTAVATLRAAASTSAFVSKFNSSGTYQYSITVDTAGTDYGYGVACDSSGNMYLAGYYSGTPTIYSINSSNVSTAIATLPVSSGAAAFVSKFNSSGTYQYSQVVDATTNADSGLGVACDSSGNVYLAGYYNGSTVNIYFVNSSNVSSTSGTLPASTSTAAFVSKFNSSGTYQYSRIIDTAGADSGNGVACDSSGNMYLTGSYNGTPTIKDQAGTSLGTLPASSGAAAFLSKFNSSGTYQYSRIIDATTNSDVGNGVTCDSVGNVYLTGYYNGTTPPIKNEVGSTLGTLPTSATQAAFVCKFNSDGAYV